MAATAPTINPEPTFTLPLAPAPLEDREALLEAASEVADAVEVVESSAVDDAIASVSKLKVAVTDWPPAVAETANSATLSRS